jgi:hypothetical protein
MSDKRFENIPACIQLIESHLMIKYCQMGEITIMEAMKRFMKIVKEILGT